MKIYVKYFLKIYHRSFLFPETDSEIKIETQKLNDRSRVNYYQGEKVVNHQQRFLYSFLLTFKTLLNRSKAERISKAWRCYTKMLNVNMIYSCKKRCRAVMKLCSEIESSLQNSFKIHSANGNFGTCWLYIINTLNPYIG